MNAYQRAAQSLWELPEAEQAWLLERLPAEDRRKIVAARDALEANARRENDAIALQQSAADTIKHWDAQTIQQLLADEPLWVTALVMWQLEPRIAESVMEQIVPPRDEAVRLALARAPDTVKPRVVEVLLRAFLEKAERRRQTMARSDFALTLGRFTSEGQGV